MARITQRIADKADVPCVADGLPERDADEGDHDDDANEGQDASLLGSDGVGHGGGSVLLAQRTHVRKEVGEDLFTAYFRPGAIAREANEELLALAAKAIAPCDFEQFPWRVKIMVRNGSPIVEVAEPDMLGIVPGLEEPVLGVEQRPAIRGKLLARLGDGQD